MKRDKIKQPEIILDENYELDYYIDHHKAKLDWSMPNLHKHNRHEIYFLLSGDVRYVIGNDIFDVDTGDIVIIPENTIHRTLQKSGTNYERILIYFSNDFIEFVHKQLGSNNFENFLHMGCVRLSKKYQERIAHIFSKMEHEQARPDDFSAPEVAHLLCEMIVLLLRHGNSVEQEVADTTESHIMDAVQYIQKNYDQELNLQSVARIACMEATYFSKSFKKMTGFGFHDFLVQTRLKKAEEFLRDSPFSINKISEICGFMSSNHFGDVFKKYKGVSPREYKKLAK